MTVPLSTGGRSPVRQSAQPLDQKDAFEALLTPVLGTAYRAALHLTRDPSDTEEVVQEAALLAFRAFGSFEPGTNFKAWFLRILTNEFLSRCRHVRRPPGTVSLDGPSEASLSDEAYAESIATRSANPGHFSLSTLATEQITRAIQALPVVYRTVATLYFVEDLSYEDMATIVGCPVGTVRSRLHRGRRMLRRALWQLAQDHSIGGTRDA